jgi:hypothetical protein
MNIFVLDEHPVVAAQMQCNKHVVKMIVESAQLLCTAFPNGTMPYMHTHFNHPCAAWVRKSRDNFSWLQLHAEALCIDYTKRYGRIHASQSVIERVGNTAIEFESLDMTPFVQCMPDAYKRANAIDAYRAYYIGEKSRFAKWSPRAKAPDWWPDGSA